MSRVAEYRKLGGGAGLVRRSRLWLGADHLLLVQSDVFTEQYRRFYFNDIEAVVISEVDNPYAYYGYMFAAFAAVFTVAFAATGMIGAAIPAGIAAIAVFVFTISRPSCRCYLRTRVSIEELRPWKRMDNARQAMLELKQHVERIQGALGRELIAEFPRERLGRPVRGLTIRPVRHYNGTLHYLLFAAMIAIAALTPVRIKSYSLVFANIMGGAHIVVILIAVVAAIWQHGTDLSRAVRTMVALALCWFAISFTGGTLIVATTIGGAYRNPAAFQYWRDPIRDIDYANAVAYAVMGLIGLTALLIHKRDSTAG